MTGAFLRAIEAFDAHLATERNFSPHTRRAYAADLRQLASFLGPQADPARVEPADVRAFLADCHRRLSAATVGRKLAALRGFFGHLVRSGARAADPSLGLPAPRAPRRLPRPLPVDDCQQLAEAGRENASARDLALVEVLYGAGLRVAELCGLDLRDVDPARGELRVLGKGRKERVVPLPSAAREALRALPGRGAAARRAQRAAVRGAAAPGGRGAAPPRPARRPPHPAPAGAGGGPRGPRPPPSAAAQLRDAPPRHGGRPARDPGAARPQEPLDHPEATPRCRPSGCSRPTTAPTRARGAPAPGRARAARDGPPRVRATTVLGVLRGGRLALASDGQVTVGNAVVKHGAEKVRTAANGRALVGFAGSAADALALSERLEAKLDAYPGNVRRAAVELARDWRTDRLLRRLEALMLVGDAETLLVVSGNGDVIEPDDGIAAIGSGGSYALAAARALVRHTALDAEAIAREALRIAAEICIYTNDRISLVTLP